MSNDECRTRVAATHQRITILLLLAMLAWNGAAAAIRAQDRRGPFTHEPRSVRSRDVDQRHIRLELRFDWDKEQMDGRAVLTLVPFREVSRIELDAAGMQVSRVARIAAEGETTLKYEQRGETLAADLDSPARAEEEITLAIDYRVTKPQHGAHFVQADDQRPDQVAMVWTQSEPEFARYWFPCIDSPSDRLTSEITATVPADYVVLSNGVLESTTDNSDGTRTWHWVQKQTHAPYLMSVVAGDFETLEQEWDGIPIVSYVPRGKLAEAERSFGKTPDMVRYFSELIGYRYPWPKYTQICVDEYMWGGMEHTSATTLNSGTLHDERAHLDHTSDDLVSHELAHQWFGDLMTCKDWGEIWLNESFATYLATLWEEHDKGWDEAAWSRRGEAESYFGEDGRYRRSIVNYRYDEPDKMFDSHSYPKGGRVLHMLRFELGDEQFFKALRHYCETNAYGTVETADLRRAIEDSTGQGMNWFFDQWLYKGGHPEFEVEWQWDDKAKSVRLTVKQTQKVDDTTPLFRTDAEIELACPGETVTRRVTIRAVQETFHFDVPARPTRVCFDPNDWILKKLVFKKSEEELLDQLAHDEHVMCRARAAMDLAEHAKKDTVQEAVLTAAKGDSFWAVRQEAIRALASANGDDVRQTMIDVAQSDAKADVRQEAIRQLGRLPHDDTRAVLRRIVANDPSYQSVAEALRALLKVDRDHCAADLLTALETPSHRDVILSAACDCLIDLKHAEAAERIQTLLRETADPDRKVLLIAAVSRLRSDDPATVDLLKEQIDNRRPSVRRRAFDALADLGDPRAIDWLQERRGKEEQPGMVRAVDGAIEKLRGKERDLEKLRGEVESLRRKNEQLEERLKKLEAAAAK